MNRTNLFRLSKVVVFLLFLSTDVSKAAPIPRGATYEITAKILAVNEESKKSSFNIQDNAKFINMSIEIEIIKVGSMIEKGQTLESTNRDNYKAGQRIKAIAKIKEDDFLVNEAIFKVNATVKGMIYSHGDESGRWYILNIDTKK